MWYISVTVYTKNEKQCHSNFSVRYQHNMCLEFELNRTPLKLYKSIRYHWICLLDWIAFFCVVYSSFDFSYLASLRRLPVKFYRKNCSYFLLTFTTNTEIHTTTTLIASISIQTCFTTSPYASDTLTLDTIFGCVQLRCKCEPFSDAECHISQVN